MNAPAQTVPRIVPPSILASLRACREEIQVQKRRDERDPNPSKHFDYFDAEDVVPACRKKFAAHGLDLVSPSWALKPVGSFLALSRPGVICHSTGEEFSICAEWPLDAPTGQAMAGALTQSLSALYRSALDLVKGDGTPSVVLKSDQTPKDKPAERSHNAKRSTARQIGALARANGITPADDVSEREQREEAEELARVEAEKKANADPRFRDEAPMADPPGLMDDDPTMPPTPASALLQSRAGAWASRLVSGIPGLKTGSDLERVSEARHEVTAAQQNNEGESSSVARSDGSPASPGVVPGVDSSQPDSGNSDTSSGGPCKRAPESTLAADQRSMAGEPNSESSAGGTASPSGPPAPGPRDECALCQVDLSGKRDPETGATTITVRLECRGCGRQACLNCTRGTPERLRCRECAEHGDRHTRTMLQPTPSQVSTVSKVAESVLAKRTAEGRASKWATATTREARKAALCAVCQPVIEGQPQRSGEWEPVIKAGDKHRDGGKRGRCCWSCWTRLESEAAGAGKGSAA